MSSEQTEEKPKRRTFDEAMREVAMTPEELAALEAAPAASAEEKARMAADGGRTPPEGAWGPDDAPEPSPLAEAAERDPDEIPDWVSFPPRFKIPPGKECTFMRFRSAWTETKSGDRWCMMWPLTDKEEVIATKACRGDGMRFIPEMAKASIRVIDGQRAVSVPVDGCAEIGRFWHDIGPKCRQMISNYYIRAHALDREQQADFFTSCVVTRVASVR